MLPGVEAEEAARISAAASGGGGSLPGLLTGLREKPTEVQRVLRKALGSAKVRTEVTHSS